MMSSPRAAPRLMQSQYMTYLTFQQLTQGVHKSLIGTIGQQSNVDYMNVQASGISNGTGTTEAKVRTEASLAMHM